MPLFHPPARVRPYFGYRNGARLRLTARALRMRETGWEHRGTVRKLAAMLGQFASQEVPELAVTLELSLAGGEVRRIGERTDHEGFVHFDVEAGRGALAQHDPSWEVGRLHWENRDGPQSAEAYILAPGDTHRLAVISDIDDTIVETGAGDLIRNWRRVLAQMPGDREPVPGAAAFYRRLGGEGTGAALPAPRRPFFYISSSPWNLFDYLVAFQKLHRLPEGPILLRDWDFDRATVTSRGHEAHKARAIDSLVAFYPRLRFVLIGDSTQADALAYARAVERHPGRIAAVFVRQAPGAELGAEERAALAAIASAGVPLWTGSSYEVGEDFLRSIGFSAGGQTSRIVHTIDGSPAARPAVPAVGAEGSARAVDSPVTRP